MRNYIKLITYSLFLFVNKVLKLNLINLLHSLAVLFKLFIWFKITIISTIGYGILNKIFLNLYYIISFNFLGHIYPITNYGKFAVSIYSLLGIIYLFKLNSSIKILKF